MKTLLSVLIFKQLVKVCLKSLLRINFCFYAKMLIFKYSTFALNPFYEIKTNINLEYEAH